MFKYLFFGFCTIIFLSSCNQSAKNNSLQSASGADSVQVTVDDDSHRQFLVRVGDIAPDFEIEFPNGEKKILSSLRGKVIMLQFTASWCGVCRKEMPHIEKEIWQKHKHDSNFVLWGIDREEPVEKINELKKSTQVTYPIGLDPDDSIFGLFAEKEAGITRNVIIDKDGKIVMLTRLFEEEEFKRMVEVINQLLLAND